MSLNVHHLPIDSRKLFLEAIAFARYVYFRACVASSTTSDLFVVYDLVIEHVEHIILPISNS